MFIQFLFEQWMLVSLLLVLVIFFFNMESRKAGATVSPQVLSQMVNKQDAVLLDIRDSGDFSGGHIVGSLNIPVAKFAERKVELEKHKAHPIIVVCKMGQSASGIAKQLTQDGYQVFRLRGGISEWQSSQMPLVKH
jgi:rhodanese-related sulfurtransferase